ncbi:hypothetical protein [Streptomyces sp. NPDC047009]|uniref:hypothetical protein n=1 Tax=Streptomyces sp. NPDC047009 TaxID=3154496 RepID=UPI0033EED2BE
MVLPKKGNREDECEDAYCVFPEIGLPGTRHVGPVVASISDGASESMLAGVWAHKVAWHTAENAHGDPATLAGPNSSYADLIAQLKGRWSTWIADYVRQRSADGRPLQWYEEVKLTSGAYATLLAIRLDLPDTICAEEPRVGTPWLWRAAALGDSCLFQVRGERILTYFPVKSSTDFGVNPDLLGSRNHNISLICQRTHFISGGFERGDDFFLMTDALAAWFVSVIESKVAGELLTALRQLRYFGRYGDKDSFQTWVSDLVAEGSLRNDDITLIHLSIQR